MFHRLGHGLRPHLDDRWGARAYFGDVVGNLVAGVCLWDDAYLPGNAERSTSHTTTALLCSRSRAA